MRTVGVGLVAALALCVSVNAATVSGAFTQSIVAHLEADPATDHLLVQVDTWGGLVILHGWTRTAGERDRVLAKVRNLDGVEAVYNYITTDADTPDLARIMNQSERLRVATANMNDEIFDLGLTYDIVEGQPDATIDAVSIEPLVPLPNELGLRVKERLDIGDFTRYYDLRADSFDRLIILHGRVPDLRTKREAEAIAANTPGVAHVFSYLSVDEPLASARTFYVDTLLTDSAYVVSMSHPDERIRERRRVQEPVYVRYEGARVSEEPVNVTYKYRAGCDVR